MRRREIRERGKEGRVEGRKGWKEWQGRSREEGRRVKNFKTFQVAFSKY
jgi:hypothetical protein